jgi:hypothetical protein
MRSEHSGCTMLEMGEPEDVQALNLSFLSPPIVDRFSFVGLAEEDIADYSFAGLVPAAAGAPE